MLDYGWQNQSHIMLTDEETGQDSVQNRPEYHFYSTENHSEPPNYINPDTHLIPHPQLPFPHEQNPNPNTHFTNYFYDSGPSYQHADASTLTLKPVGQTGFMMLPKTEPLVNFNTELMMNSRLGLNLGGRTYFSSSEDYFVNRFYRRSRILEPGLINFPRCQAEACNADLTNCKHYHRRHKVCEYHSKAATASVAGLTQRFCQQCSRFHILSEFDNGKRSCRRRLADHNRRRRKSQQSNQENSNKSQLDGNATNSSSENLTRSPHSSSVTVAISPPRISLDCYGYGSH